MPGPRPKTTPLAPSPLRERMLPISRGPDTRTKLPPNSFVIKLMGSGPVVGSAEAGDPRSVYSPAIAQLTQFTLPAVGFTFLIEPADLLSGASPSASGGLGAPIGRR